MTTSLLSVNNKKDLPESELFSVKQIAEQLGTSYDTVNNAVKRLFSDSIKNGKKTLLTKEQVTVLIQELKKNKTVNERVPFEVSSKVQKTSTELTPALKIKQAMLLMQEGYEEELSLLKAKNLEMKPKADVYDRICDSTGLKTVEQVASNLGWGKKNFFDLMRGMGIFYYGTKESDGRKINLPKQQYKDSGYFVTKEEPYKSGEKEYLYTKIYVTGKGEAWLAKKLNKTIEETADKCIEVMGGKND